MYAAQANGPQYVPVDPFKPSIAFSLNNFPTWFRRARARVSPSSAGNNDKQHSNVALHLEQAQGYSGRSRPSFSSSPRYRRYAGSVDERRESPDPIQRADRRSYFGSVRHRHSHYDLSRLKKPYPPVVPERPPVPRTRQAIISDDQLRGRSLYRHNRIPRRRSVSNRSRRRSSSCARGPSIPRSLVQENTSQEEHRLCYHTNRLGGSPSRSVLQSISLQDIESKSRLSYLPISLRRHSIPQPQPSEESLPLPSMNHVSRTETRSVYRMRAARSRSTGRYVQPIVLENPRIITRNRSSSRSYPQNQYQQNIRQEYKNTPPESGHWVPIKLERNPTPLQPIEDLPSTPSLIFAFVLDTVPRQIYLHMLLRLPYLYYSRVTRIFEEAEMSLPIIREGILDAAKAKFGQGATIQSRGQPGLIQASGNHTFLGLHPEPPKSNTAYLQLQDTWQSFIDSLLREWKTLNIISVLLLSAILTILQIESAASDPLTRYAALLSMICALMSLLYGCIYIIRFGTMRKTYKGAEWAEEAQRSTTGIFWNVWVLLAMPATWLSWSMILYIITVMAFVWRTSPIATDDTSTSSVSINQILAAKTLISCVLALGIIYLGLIASTLRRYGAMMDRAWQRRIWNWMTDGVANTHLHINANTVSPLLTGPPKSPSQYNPNPRELPVSTDSKPVPLFSTQFIDQYREHVNLSQPLPNSKMSYDSFIQNKTSPIPRVVRCCTSPSHLEFENNTEGCDSSVKSVIGSPELVRIFEISLDDPHIAPSSFIRELQGSKPPGVVGNIPDKDALLTQFDLLRKGLRLIIALSAAPMERPENWDADCLSKLSFAVREFNELLQESHTAGQVILCHETIKKRPGILRLAVYYSPVPHFLYDTIFPKNEESASSSKSSITEALDQTRTIPCSLPSGVERLEVVSPLLQVNFKRSSDPQGDFTEERKHEIRCEEEHKIAGCPPIRITFVNSKPVATKSTGKQENKVLSI